MCRKTLKSKDKVGDISQFSDYNHSTTHLKYTINDELNAHQYCLFNWT